MLPFHIAFPADIVFIVKDKPHPIFERDADDLVYTATVPLGKVILASRHICPVLVPSSVMGGRLKIQ